MKSPAQKPTTRAAAAKKTAAKKSAAKTPATTPTDEAPTVYILDDLAKSHGPATEDEVFALVDRDRPSLVADGAKVGTPRISTDSARIYGRASDFFASATPVQKSALRGFSADLTRIAIWAALRGQELYEQRRRADSAGASRQEQRQEDGRALRQQAVARREQLATLLRLAAGGNEQHEADIARAYGRIATPEELAQALDELVKLGQKYLGSGNPALKRRSAIAGLDAAYLTEAAALAKSARDRLKVATASREAPVVSQADIDLWDGVNLYLLERIIDLFEVGNQLEPTVPRLLPVSLRYWFKPAAKKAATPEPESPPPTA